MADIFSLRTDRSTYALGLLVFGPVLVILVFSIIYQPVIISRTLSPIAPFYYLLIGATITRSRNRTITFSLIALPTLAIILLLAGLHAGGMGRYSADKSDLDGLYQPGDGVFHANAGSYVTWAYYRPDMPHYVWGRPAGLDETLTTRTRRAMGIREADFDKVACDHSRWWLFYFHNPTTSQAEIDYIDHIISDYPSEEIDSLRTDQTVEAGLYRVDPVCGKDPKRLRNKTN
jgi:hypothetical protein